VIKNESAITAFLAAHGAARIMHPGGTLLAHLLRTARLLEAWDAPNALVAAGLCHAAYGTDGFPTALLGLDRRHQLVTLIGPEAEAITYAYCCCDRSYGLPTPDRGGRNDLRDRFTSTHVVPDAELLAGLVELTCANEIDVLLHSPALVASAGDEIADLLLACRPLASASASAAIGDTIRSLGLRTSSYSGSRGQSP